MMKNLLHIISHTDLDGVAAAAVAWHANKDSGRLVRVSLTGYGEVDALILETLRAGEEPLVLDLFCQRQETVDEIDSIWQEGREPFLFDITKAPANATATGPGPISIQAAAGPWSTGTG